jgi:3-deoxy-D-manno-octulosonic acid kinase
MEENKLTIPILLRFAIKYKMLWQIYTLTPYIENCVSLKEVVLKDCIDKKKIISSGEKIARMHKIGIFHSDLNLGNIIFDKQEVYLIDFKNSYIYDSPLNKLLCKKNLIRLLRSYIKERMRAKKKAEEDFLQFLIEGYSSVIKEDWVKRISFENFSVKLHALSYKIRF